MFVQDTCSEIFQSTYFPKYHFSNLRGKSLYSIFGAFISKEFGFNSQNKSVRVANTKVLLWLGF